MADDVLGMDGSSDPLNLRDSGRPLSAIVYDKLREMLRNGELKPGVRVRERDIASRLQVSRTPVREALSRLQSRRLVELSSGRLTIVEFSRRQIIELFGIRGILEGAAARLAAEIASPTDVAQLRYLLEVLRKCQSQPLNYSRINRKFHEAIYEAAHNQYIVYMAQDLQDYFLMLPNTTFAIPGRIELTQSEYERLVDAIEHRRPDEAERLAREHFTGTLNARLNLMFANEQGGT